MCGLQWIGGCVCTVRLLTGYVSIFESHADCRLHSFSLTAVKNQQNCRVDCQQAAWQSSPLPPDSAVSSSTEACTGKDRGFTRITSRQGHSSTIWKETEQIYTMSKGICWNLTAAGATLKITCSTFVALQNVTHHVMMMMKFFSAWVCFVHIWIRPFRVWLDLVCLQQQHQSLSDFMTVQSSNLTDDYWCMCLCGQSNGAWSRNMTALW